MDKEQLAKMVADKIDAALKNSEHPKKFFITANGRGVKRPMISVSRRSR